MKFQKAALLSLILFLSSCVSVPEESNEPKTSAYEAYKQTIIRHSTYFSRCYVQAVQRDRQIQGTVQVLFRVSKDGLLQKAEVSEQGTTLKDPQMHNCILTTLKALKFPRRTDANSVDMNYPFVYGK